MNALQSLFVLAQNYRFQVQLLESICLCSFPAVLKLQRGSGMAIVHRGACGIQCAKLKITLAAALGDFEFAQFGGSSQRWEDHRADVKTEGAHRDH